jgi:hypothetical protein
MWRTMVRVRTRTLVVGLLCAAALLAGCQSTVPGAPTTRAGSPTEPSFSTPRPSRTPPSPPPSTSQPPTSKPSASGPPPGAQVLPTESGGYSFIETKSGQTRCQIDATTVGCEAPFTHPPEVDGVPANGVEISANGKNHWIVGNLGDPPVVTLDYRTYAAQGWTIVATEAGTRFTNDGTGHGMFVSVEKVELY